LGIDESALDVLVNWAWPGNVRELENSLEYSIIKSKNETYLNIHDLPIRIKEKAGNSKPENNNHTLIEQSNTQLIELLNIHKWNKTKVAEILGVDRTTLWRRLKSLGIE